MRFGLQCRTTRNSVYSHKPEAKKTKWSPEYRLEFGEILQNAGVEIVVVDNDKKAHSKTVADARAKFGIKEWPGAGKVKNRTPIDEFTAEDGGFPVNSHDCIRTKV